MTPAPVAEFMASLIAALPAHVRLLDAGAGVGALTAAFVHRACAARPLPKTLHATLYEVDAQLVSALKETLAACESECARVGVQFNAEIISEDFILHSAMPLFDTHGQSGRFNCAILNPPYAKIQTSSRWRAALRALGIETSNLYAAFVAVAVQQLGAGGQLVAITPRSFCNGSYFEPFRRFLLERTAIEQIHVYESRKKAFKDDAVLQENVIFRLTKAEKQPAAITISSSNSPASVEIAVRSVPFAEVVVPSDPHKFIRLATTDADSALAGRVSALPDTLASLGLNASTGRVVDFRAKEQLRACADDGTVPLIYPQHFRDGFVAWPKPEGRKPNALLLDDYTRDQVLPNATFVLTKRFTSKEEKRRLAAVVYEPSAAPGQYIAFENHLNYFHANGRGLPPDLARGLSLFLNSTAVDQFFRQFSGHTQVNATDLRNLHYPSRDALRALGTQMNGTMPDQDGIDALVAPLLS
jgi:adenine-specific DNA-methyltransferase